MKTALPVRRADEMTGPRPLELTAGAIRVRVPAGDVQVIALQTGAN